MGELQMIANSSRTRMLAYLLLGASVLIGIIHVWYPITISPPKVSDRTGVPVTMAIFAALTVYGYRWARIAIGFSVSLFALINLLIALAYFPTLSISQLVQFSVLSLILGTTGGLFLFWQGARIFEEEREKQKLIHS